jgi:PAS domain S-box-containing protein
MNALKKIRVLYVEDDIEHANIIIEMLSKCQRIDYQVEHRGDLQSSISYLKSIDCNIDVILLDLMLPDSKGINTFKQVYDVCKVPVVIISAHEDIAHSCIEFGAQDYLVKPDISPSLVARSLEYAIGRHKSNKKIKESEVRFKLLSDASFEGVTITRNGIFLDVNDQFCKMVDTEREDIIGKKIIDFVSPEHREIVENNLMNGYEKPYEHIAIKKDGTKFPVEIHGRTLADGLRLTAVRNMTRYKEVEQREELIFNELENKLHEWRQELSLKSIENRMKLEKITLNINSMISPEVQ